MSNRQKLYIGLALSAGVCTGIGLFLYLRHRRQAALSKTPNTNNDSLTASSILSSLKSRRGHQYTEITSSSEGDNDDSELVRFQSDEGATIEVEIPGGGTALTPDQAIILTRFLDENNNDLERLHRVLTNIANAATFKESQVNLANAGCINRLREILSTTNNETTQCKILLALNNLALNDYTITHFSGIVAIVINLCRTTPSHSLVRLYGLNLLINMSVLEYLHYEFMENISELGLLIESTFDNLDEALSAGKILVNLSANKLNVENLVKLTGIELKTIVNLCTPSKKMIDSDKSSKLEDILLRYLNFYCNLAETIVKELQEGNNYKSLLNDPIPYRQGSVYFELFDQEKQMISKSILRPQYSLGTINSQIKRLRQAMDTIRQMQFDSSLSAIQNEFDTNDRTDSSTPKKASTRIDNIEDSLDNLEQEVNEQFDDGDNTILPGSTTPSNQSLASFCSAYSTNDNNTFTSPEKSIST